MDADTIREKINTKAYDSKVAYPTARKISQGHVFDEEKSVKWNKEEVERQNAEAVAQMKAYRESGAEGHNDFREDVIAYVIENYSIKDNRDIAEKIFSKAQEDGHSSGKSEILNQAVEIADFVSDILELTK